MLDDPRCECAVRWGKWRGAKKLHPWWLRRQRRQALAAVFEVTGGGTPGRYPSRRLSIEEVAELVRGAGLPVIGDEVAWLANFGGVLDFPAVGNQPPEGC